MQQAQHYLERLPVGTILAGSCRLKMRAIIQRVHSASVTVENSLISSIGKGLLVFAAVGHNDTPKEAEAMASKVLKFKLWDDDENNRWRRSVRDIDGEVLCVSQFTLLASTKTKNKPNFQASAGLEKPERVKDGVFQAKMDVALINDGPVTFELSVEPSEGSQALGKDLPKIADEQS